MTSGDAGSYLPPVLLDETTMVMTEFQESVREELLDAANELLEKVGGVDWYDLSMEDCSVLCSAPGQAARAGLKLISRGRRRDLEGVHFGKATALAARLAGVLRLSWPVERDRRTGKVKGGRQKGLVDLAHGLRIAKTLLVLRDAVARYPHVARPDFLVRLIDLYSGALRPDAAGVLSLKRFRGRLGKSAGLAGGKGLRTAYGSLVLGNRGHKAILSLPADSRREVRKTLWKLREKIRLEAEKTGLMDLPGGLEGGVATGLDTLDQPLDLPPLDFPPLGPRTLDQPALAAVGAGDGDGGFDDEVL